MDVGVGGETCQVRDYSSSCHLSDLRPWLRAQEQPAWSQYSPLRVRRAWQSPQMKLTELRVRVRFALHFEPPLAYPTALLRLQFLRRGRQWRVRGSKRVICAEWPVLQLSFALLMTRT